MQKPHKLPDIDPVCWAAVLADLCGGRVSSHAIARSLDIPRSTLRGWLDGAQPGHADGERVIVLWMRVTGKPRELVPTEGRTMSAGSMRA